MAAGFILQYMAAGTTWVEDRLRILPVNWIGSAFCWPPRPGRSLAVRQSVPDVVFRSMSTCRSSARCRWRARPLFDLGVFGLVVGATVLMLIALAHQSIRKPARRPKRRNAGSEEASNGADVSRSPSAFSPAPASGLLLRPRTYQVIIGLSLLSYAVNLFIFSMGRLRVGAPPVLQPRAQADPRGLRGPGSAGAGADGDRHRLCHDGAVPGRPARRRAA